MKHGGIPCDPLPAPAHVSGWGPEPGPWDCHRAIVWARSEAFSLLANVRQAVSRPTPAERGGTPRILLVLPRVRGPAFRAPESCRRVGRPASRGQSPAAQDRTEPPTRMSGKGTSGTWALSEWTTTDDGDTMTTTTLRLAQIRTDGGTQPRAEINPDVVAEYAEILDLLPPVVVFYDGSSYWLADGFHRFRAVKLAGAKAITADVRQGSQRDAILYSVGANATHGVRRTNADKRRAVETLLRDAEWQGRSNRWIADTAHVSPGLVAEVRGPSAVAAQEVTTEAADAVTTAVRDASTVPPPTQAKDLPPKKRAGRDGKDYPAKAKSSPAEPSMGAPDSPVPVVLILGCTTTDDASSTTFARAAMSKTPPSAVRWDPPCDVPGLIEYLGDWYDDDALREIIQGLTVRVPQPLPVPRAPRPPDPSRIDDDEPAKILRVESYDDPSQEDI